MGSWLQVGTLNRQLENLPVRKSFNILVLLAVIGTLLLSTLTLTGLYMFRTYLLPDSDAIYLTVLQEMEDGSSMESTIRMDYGDEAIYAPNLVMTDFDPQGTTSTKYAIEKVETSYSQLSEKRKLAYRMSGIAMGIMPFFYALTSVFICGFIFYKKKLDKPIQTLRYATEEIARNNLDFTIDYASEDEFGQLCTSFEKMRAELSSNNRKMWTMLEERKFMQNSLAHDLRNPIAIIEGYTEYLMINLSKRKIDNERLLEIASNLNVAAKRLNSYTDSIREINRLEEMKINPVEYEVQSLFDELALDLEMLVTGRPIKMIIESSVDIEKIYLDRQVLYRIVENVVNNAVRFANREVRIHISHTTGMLRISIEDDGPGFPSEVLKGKATFPYTSDETGEHQGIGLVLSRILCQKHGGQLHFTNKETGGAYVEINMKV